VWHVFRVRKVTINKPRFTTNPPQIHHQKTTFNHPFLPKPPAKTHISPQKIKGPIKFLIGPFFGFGVAGEATSTG
jgi:hypothetical protein